MASKIIVQRVNNIVVTSKWGDIYELAAWCRDAAQRFELLGEVAIVATIPTMKCPDELRLTDSEYQELLFIVRK